jgi:acyl carrier protein
MEESIKRLMADVLGIEPQSIDVSTTMDGVDSWGSLAHLNICFAVEEEFNLRLEVKEMEAMISFSAIAEVVKARV